MNNWSILISKYNKISKSDQYQAMASQTKNIVASYNKFWSNF